MYMLLGIMFGLENYYIFIYKYILYLFAFIEFAVCSNRPRRGKGKGPIWPQRGESVKNKLGGFTEWLSWLRKRGPQHQRVRFLNTIFFFWNLFHENKKDVLPQLWEPRNLKCFNVPFWKQTPCNLYSYQLQKQSRIWFSLSLTSFPFPMSTCLCPGLNLWRRLPNEMEGLIPLKEDLYDFYFPEERGMPCIRSTGEASWFDQEAEQESGESQVQQLYWDFCRKGKVNSLGLNSSNRWVWATWMVSDFLVTIPGLIQSRRNSCVCEADERFFIEI